MDAALATPAEAPVLSGPAHMGVGQEQGKTRDSGGNRAAAEATGRAAEGYPDAAQSSERSPGPITLVCALRIEEKAATRGGSTAARVGLKASLPLPKGRIAGFGLAGALVPGLPAGTLLTAERVVDESGATLWEGKPLLVRDARPAVLCAAERVVDGPVERAALAERTGAVAVEMESGTLAATGRLAGVVRAVADSPDRPVGLLARASTQDGRTAWGWVTLAFLVHPVKAYRVSRDARQALTALTRAASGLGGTP